ncbi:MAG TPA: DUF882 domain-containing protein, partial [Rhizomicrobium sp.]|nr:DUF882 domain-containing protein [Rhizomicrobium sp.]
MRTLLARREFLRASGGALLVAGTAGIVPARAAAARHLNFENLHTGEKLALAYWSDGSYHPEALAQINHVL